MNSSTSNFDATGVVERPPRPVASVFPRPSGKTLDGTLQIRSEIKAVLLTLLVLLCADVALRLAELKLSNDVRHIRSLPEIARALSSGPTPRVVFLGNSLTRFGVAPAAWTSALEELNVPKGSMAKVVPDESTMPDWYYVVRNNLIEPGREPDLLILGFALNQLTDERLQPGRLGAYFCNRQNVRELFAHDLPGLGAKCDFLMGSMSRLYGVRDEIQVRFGDAFIPGYRESVQHLNKTRLRKSAPGNLQTTGGKAHSYALLERALKLWREKGIEVVLVAMPTPYEYELDPAVAGMAQSAGVRLIDARKLAALTAEDFPDGYHMGKRAAEIYTRYLAESVVDTLREKAGAE
ncbi:MAG: hypothetical protein AB1705_00360 [Verrucomicrobiota bacterium]